MPLNQQPTNQPTNQAIRKERIEIEKILNLWFLLGLHVLGYSEFGLIFFFNIICLSMCASAQCINFCSLHIMKPMNYPWSEFSNTPEKFAFFKDVFEMKAINLFTFLNIFMQCSVLLYKTFKSNAFRENLLYFYQDFICSFFLKKDKQKFIAGNEAFEKSLHSYVT